MRTVAKKDHTKYARHEASATFGYGAGPLRPRAILQVSYGECSCCGLLDDLRGGMCSWCLWMQNDKEANEEW